MGSGGWEVAVAAAIGAVLVKIVDKLLPKRPVPTSVAEREAVLGTRMVEWMNRIEAELDEARAAHEDCTRENASLRLEVGMLKAKVEALGGR